MFVSCQITTPMTKLFQAYLAQINASTPPLQVQLPSLLQSQGHEQKKPSKGIKGYPDGWQLLLNSAKDLVRTSVLFKNPFPSPNISRTMVDECFNEAFVAKCSTNELVLEPGTSLSKNHNRTLTPPQKRILVV